MSDGTVWAWGDNMYGQLGQGSTATVAGPVLVGGLNNVVAVAAGARHCLAVRNDGTVWAWGENSGGRLGDGTSVDRSSPVRVVGLGGVVAVAAGVSHNLALKSDGTVWTWDANSPVPVLVAGLDSVTQIDPDEGACGVAAGGGDGVSPGVDGA